MSTTDAPIDDAPARPAPRPGTARAALGYRDFRVLFIGLALSNVGTWMQNFTLPAYLDDRTESAALVGLLVFTQLGPLLLLSLPAGILADKLPRRPFLVCMQAIQLATTVVMAGLIATDAALWTIFVTQFAIGTANALNAPALQASVPLLVDRKDLPGAISLNSANINGSRVMGPAFAALLAAVGLGVPGILMVNAVTYLFLIGALLMVRIPDVRGVHPEQGWRRLLTGVNIVKRRKVLSRGLTAMFLFSLLSLPYIGLFPSVARLNLGISATGSAYKWLYVTWGVGAFAGALAVGTFLSRFDKRWLNAQGFAGVGVSLAVFALMTSSVPAFPVVFVLGFCYFMTATSLVTVLQQNMADTERAAVMPLWFMAFGGTVPIGNLIFGPVMDAIGARPVLLFGAVVAVLLSRWADLGRLSADDFLPEELGGEPFTPVNASRSI